MTTTFRRATRAGFAAVALAAAAFAGTDAHAKNTGLIFVSNEKSSTITVLDRTDTVVRSFDTCARPRGMVFSKDRTQFYVACGDDSIIAVYDVATQKLVRRYRGIAQPETFDLHPDGRHLYISNEEDAAASVLDLETGKIVGEFDTGEEPEGVRFTSDGRLVFVASEAANMVHVIDTEKGEVIKDILVDTRPRRLALTPDDKELWVSAELAGIVDIIDVATLKIVGDVTFLPTGFRKEQVTPVDVLISRDGRRAYVALGRANHVGVVDVKARKVTNYILVPRREETLRDQRAVRRPVDHRHGNPECHQIGSGRAGALRNPDR